MIVSAVAVAPSLVITTRAKRERESLRRVRLSEERGRQRERPESVLECDDPPSGTLAAPERRPPSRR